MLGWRVAIVDPTRAGVDFMCRPAEVGAEFPVDLSVYAQSLDMLIGMPIDIG